MGFGDFLSSASGGSIIGGAIGAIGSLIGGGMSANAAAQNAAQQYAYQKEFAQNGIRWKVADAKASGIHPLAALGSQTFSYNPVMVGGSDNGIGDALQQMGQGVSRAVAAKQQASERAASDAVRALQIEGLKLDNKRKELDIRNEQTQQAFALADRVAAIQQQPPPMPIVNDSGKGGPASTTFGVNPFWDHYRNFDWLTPVPSGDLKDYAGENILVNLASHLAYASSAWNGEIRPDDSSFTSEERAKLRSGMYSPFFTPIAGWRVEPNLRRYLSRLLPFVAPSAVAPLVRWLSRKK